MSLLIAEIGNCHLGSMKLARELIRQAHESGADLIKGQAFVAADIKTGSMPQKFYEVCAFTEEQYLELIQYARNLGTDMFYSIFSPGFDRIRKVQRWTKHPASQAYAFTPEQDSTWAVVSYYGHVIKNAAPAYSAAPSSLVVPRLGWALYATPYLPEDPELHLLDVLSDLAGGAVGLSDHTKSYHSCLKAVRNHGVNCIEKHFTLQKDVCWDGTIFRDTVHGATPRELEIIANALH